MPTHAVTISNASYLLKKGILQLPLLEYKKLSKL